MRCKTALDGGQQGAKSLIWLGMLGGKRLGLSTLPGEGGVPAIGCIGRVMNSAKKNAIVPRYFCAIPNAGA